MDENKKLRILILEDVATDAKLIERELRKEKMAFTSKLVATRKSFTKELKDFAPDLILSDYSLPSFDGLAALEIAQEKRPDAPFIIVSGAIGEELAAETVKRGATDYVSKGRLSRLVPVIRRALQEVGEKIKRKQAEENLRKSEELFRLISENMADLVAVIDLDGKRLYNNSAYKKILGDPESIKGTYSFNEIHPDDREKVKQIFQETIKTGIGQKAEFRFLSKDGNIYFIESQGSVIQDKEGKPLKVVVVSHDITERKRAEGRIQRQLQRLSTLRTIDIAITTSLDMRVTLNIILDQTIAQLGIDAAGILLFNPHTSLLEYAVSRGFRTEAIQTQYLCLLTEMGRSYANKAANERRIVNIPNLAKDLGDLIRSPLLTDEGFIAYYAVPLIAKGKINGVLEIFHRSPLNPDVEWLSFLEALAGQIAIAIDNATLFDDLQRSNVELTLAYNTTIEGWSKALDLRDKETEGHSQRVAEMTLRIAEAMGIKDEELVHIRRGALLHDIGKMGIPDNILLKPDKLNQEEWEIMKKHPVYAYELLSPIDFLRLALDIPYCHHEKWDGSGYPRGLKGEQIPIGARIFAVADVWDALRSDRPYRVAWSEDKAIKVIKASSGKHFDPKVVEVFLKLIANPSKT